MKFNQIYVPKKHIHKSSAPTTPLYKDRDIKNYYYNIYNSNDQRYNNLVRYNYNNYNKINNRSCEKRTSNNTYTIKCKFVYWGVFSQMLTEPSSLNHFFSFI